MYVNMFGHSYCLSRPSTVLSCHQGGVRLVNYQQEAIAGPQLNQTLCTTQYSISQHIKAQTL
jgi:hypothetical protein